MRIFEGKPDIINWLKCPCDSSVQARQRNRRKIHGRNKELSTTPHLEHRLGKIETDKCHLAWLSTSPQSKGE
jgi:hypothetical protein